MDACIDAMHQVIKSGDDLGVAMLSKALALQASLRGDLTAAASHWDAAAAQAELRGYAAAAMDLTCLRSQGAGPRWEITPAPPKA